jgi:23S rRNA pseudouridine1911/1915/1917 synthase
MRLDKFLSEKYPEYSRSMLASCVKSGRVRIDGEVATSPAKTVDESQKIEFQQPAKPDFSGSSLPIIYEDDNVLVINKPAGVLTHAKGNFTEEFTVAEFVKKYWPQSSSNRAGIVHRLDRGTSGVVVVAKNQETAGFLQKQFAARKVKKTYIAIVNGTPREVSAKIDLPIARNPKKPAEFKVDAKGKNAVTFYQVLVTNEQGESLIELKPETGRTHQLRVHMQYLKTPIKGDVVYGQAADRMYLHAKSLEITIPGSPNQRKIFKAPEPPGFTKGFNV